jgi:hypothetical protein
MHPDGMGWSWEQVQGTPEYVKKFCRDFLNIKARVVASERDRAKRPRGGQM